jgi:predicted GTPase
MTFFDRIWNTVAEQLFGSPASSQDQDSASAQAQVQAQGVAPVIWLIGKTGAGKTSIIAALTGDDRAKVGRGFEPCTRTASVYDFPREAPAVRFLDTRGLEEVDYDAGEDITWCEGQAHLLLAVMSVADPDQASVVDVIRQV